jgi:lysyl-tRNA synthetase, class II
MSSDTKSTLAQIRDQRIEKANKLRNLGIDPYPPKSEKTHTNSEITSNFEQFENKEVVVAGRLMSWREHGHLIFGNIQDQSGSIQLYLKDDELGETDKDKGTLGWSDLNLIDVGDIVEAKGIVTKTQRGEISITPTTIRILTKAIRPLPDKWKGLVDKEQRYRRRYLDMTMNPDIKNMFEKRAIFWDATREFLRSKGFFEVNIPVLEHTTGGADAKPFVTYMDAINESFYLRISHELPLKKLLGGGFDRVFDIGPRFRNEGMSDEHLPEHIAMEWYWAYADMNEGMELTKELFKYVIQKTFGTLKFNLKGVEVDLEKEWEVMDFADIIKDRFSVDVFEDSEERLLEELQKHSKEVDSAMNRSRLADSLWKVIRKDIVGPVFLTGVPKFLSPLSKPMVDDPRKTQRFQPIILGSEMANAFGELNDPIDQLDRFMEQQRMRESGDDEAHMLDIDFVEMLEYGMPPACGFGMSERVFWSFQGVTAKEGVPFPAMKREFEKTTREIYSEIDFDRILEAQHTNSDNSSRILQTTKGKTFASLPSIKSSLDLLDEHIEGEYLKHHSKMVATVMASYAQKYGEDERLWYTTGLLHDLDYEKYPEEHPQKSLGWLRDGGYPEELIQAVSDHYFDHNNKPAKLPLLSAMLIACDELTGLIHAYSLMKENGYEDIDAKSVIKKLKDPKFAAGVDRRDVNFAFEITKLDVEEHINFTIKAIKNIGSIENKMLQDKVAQDMSKRFLILVRDDLTGWRLTNTVGHLSAYLGNKIQNFASVEKFETEDEKSINPNSQYPVITMTAKAGQMYNFLQKVEELGLIHLAYIEEMITYTDDTLLANAIKSQRKENLDYLGIAVFGDNETLKSITKKFSLLK